MLRAIDQLLLNHGMSARVFFVRSVFPSNIGIITLNVDRLMMRPPRFASHICSVGPRSTDIEIPQLFDRRAGALFDTAVPGA